MGALWGRYEGSAGAWEMTGTCLPPPRPLAQTRPADRNPNGEAISRVGHWWMALL